MAVGSLVLALSTGVWMSASTLAKDDGNKPVTRSTRAPKDATGGGRGIDAKLADIRTNQQEIFSRLDQVLEELQIAKIRATLRR